MSIKIGKLTLGMYQTNCYFLYKEGNSEVILVDPADSGEYIYDKLAEHGFEVKHILLTHGHFDHIYGCKSLKAKTDAKIYCHEAEAELLGDSSLNVSDNVGRPVMLLADEWLTDGEERTFSDMTFKVIHTPGHTEGSCCYYFEDGHILIAGDTLFCESVGRTDFPTGSSRKLISSIKEKLFLLPGDTRVYPGHGGSTTIDNEKENDPFLN